MERLKVGAPGALGLEALEGFMDTKIQRINGQIGLTLIRSEVFQHIQLGTETRSRHETRR